MTTLVHGKDLRIAFLLHKFSRKESKYGTRTSCSNLHDVKLLYTVGSSNDTIYKSVTCAMKLKKVIQMAVTASNATEKPSTQQAYESVKNTNRDSFIPTLTMICSCTCHYVLHHIHQKEPTPPLTFINKHKIKDRAWTDNATLVRVQCLAPVE